MIKRIFLQLPLVFLTGLNSTIFSQQIPVLDLSKAISSPVKIVAADYIESISYIPLATSLEFLVDNNPDVRVTKDYIIIIMPKKILLFNRRSGDFIREIGKYGKGPGEYRNTFGFINESSLTYYCIGWNGNLIKYSFDGAFQGNVKIPGYVDSFDSPSFPDVYSFLNDSILVCSFAVFDGTETKSMMIFNEEGRIIKIIPNKLILKKKQQSVFVTKEVLFYHFNNNLFFQNRYNDTVFHITQNQISPSFILKRSIYKPLFESRWWPIEKKQKSGFIYPPAEYFENSRFISFNFYMNKVRYLALYDKSLKSLKVTENKSGILNNINGFIDLTFSHINFVGELSNLIQPKEIIEWINQNPYKFNALRPELQILKNVKIEDNPIVVIAKFKQ